MVIENLDLQKENRVRILADNKIVFISFFKPGRMTNAYVEYDPKHIRFKQQNERFYFYGLTFQSNKKYDLKLFLPDTEFFDMSITNKGGNCIIENGYRFMNLDIEAENIALHNVIAFPNGNINMKFPYVLLGPKSSSNIYLTNSSINQLNIKGDVTTDVFLEKSTIHNIEVEKKLNVDMYNKSNIFHINSKALLLSGSHSNIDDVKSSDQIVIKLYHSNIGTILGKQGILELSQCDFNKKKNIVFNEKAYIFLKENDYRIKRKNNKKVYVLDNESNKKLMKIKAGSNGKIIY